MYYRSKNLLDQQRAQRHLNSLFAKDCGFKIIEDKERRTGQQNRYLHLLLAYFAMETGYSVEWVKRECFKKLCNKEMFVTTVNGQFGSVEDVRSSANIDTREMTTAIERFRNWSSSEAGIYLPAANEHHFLEEIEIEEQRQKTYL